MSCALGATSESEKESAVANLGDEIHVNVTYRHITRPDRFTWKD